MKLDREQSVSQLIRLAGEREMPSAEAMRRARLAAEQSWRRGIAAQPARPRRAAIFATWALATAAGIAALAWFAWNRDTVRAVPDRVATIAVVEGQVSMREATRDGPAARHTEVLAGTTLTATDGRVATNFADTLSLRLDRYTRVRFDSRVHVTLLQGSLYVDSGGLGVGPPLTITTPAGDVSHVGTQFQVTVSAQGTRVRVREGRVMLERDAAPAALAVAAGDELEVRGDEASWRHGMPSFGPEWEWSAGVAPALAIEDRPLAEFLTWIAREHGWQLQFADAALQARTHDIRLHGTLEDLDAPAMLGRMALVTGVPLEIHAGVLTVGTR